MSRLSEESTSPQRQRELIEQWAEAHEHTIVGWAEDLDVSGSVDPFDTPELGPWLTEKLGEWDILCAWKLDRLARRAVPLHRLFGLCQDEGKTLVCVSDNIDLSHWVGRLVASVIAGVAEGELEAIRERTRSSQRKLRELGRWPGGRPSYGYKAVEREDAVGWELVLDPDAAAVVRRIVDATLAGTPSEVIAKELQSAGTVPPSDHLRLRNGLKPTGAKWSGQTIRQLLRSKTILGHVTHRGATVRDSEGNPIRKGPPLVTQQEFDQIQEYLESTSSRKKRVAAASPLLDVVVCYECGHKLYHRSMVSKGKLYRYYYCQPCESGPVRADEVEEWVYQAFLDTVGHLKVREHVFVPAEDHTAALEAAIRAVDELAKMVESAQSSTVIQRLTEQMTALDGRIAELEKLPHREATWAAVETAKTYGEAWAESNTEQRRQILLKSGIRYRSYRHPGTKATYSDTYIPDEIQDLLNAKNPPTQ